jgi:hypothetical protein
MHKSCSYSQETDARDWRAVCAERCLHGSERGGRKRTATTVPRRPPTLQDLRSERQLMRHAADRLSVLWYLGVRRFGACEIAPQEQEVESKEPSRTPDRASRRKTKGKVAYQESG